MILMKRFLLIVILSFLWNAIAYARCNDDLDVSNEWVEIMSGKKDMLLTFKNKSNKDIIIAEMGLKTKSGTVMHSEKPDPEPYDPKKHLNVLVRKIFISSHLELQKDLLLYRI